MNRDGGGGGGFVALLRAGDVRTLLTRYSDLALAGLVVAIVGMMIVPLPTPLLDLLISVNIAVGVVLLLVAIYVSDALKIATFPTLLLLTTLFRLALEVSATRLILLRADGGEVIRAFGNFVVAGNLVVGAVVFLILTMIQFIVISKGSERVAELLAARGPETSSVLKDIIKNGVMKSEGRGKARFEFDLAPLGAFVSLSASGPRSS